MRRCSSHMSVSVRVCVCVRICLRSLCPCVQCACVLPSTCPGCICQRGVLALLCVHHGYESVCVRVYKVLDKRGNGWKSYPHSHFNQRNEAAVGVNRPCTKADVLISFAEEVHCDSFCASLLLSF